MQEVVLGYWPICLVKLVLSPSRPSVFHFPPLQTALCVSCNVAVSRSVTAPADEDSIQRAAYDRHTGLMDGYSGKGPLKMRSEGSKNSSGASCRHVAGRLEGDDRVSS